MTREIGSIRHAEEKLGPGKNILLNFFFSGSATFAKCGRNHFISDKRKEENDGEEEEEEGLYTMKHSLTCCGGEKSYFSTISISDTISKRKK